MNPAHQADWSDWYRRREDFLRLIRPQVNSEAIRAIRMRRHANGFLNEDATEITVWDLLRFVGGNGGAAEPLKSIAQWWSVENGHVAARSAPGRPSRRGEMRVVLASLEREGGLAGNAKQDRVLVMARLGVPEGEPGFSEKTFGDERAKFLRSHR